MALDDIYASLELLEEQIDALEQDIEAQETRNKTLMHTTLAQAIATTKAETRAEVRAELKAEKKASKQPDLFSAGWAQPVNVAKASNDAPLQNNNANAAILAKKLDYTIDKVQALLKEAGA
jgi:hypothetical protein